MQCIFRPVFASLFAALVSCGAPSSASAGEGTTPAQSARVSSQSDPCVFFRSQAYGRGLSHFATEMLWACEAVARRRAADMTLSERMLAVELALARYHAEVVSAGRSSSAPSRARDMDIGYVTTSEGLKARIAESTGTLAALEAIRLGF